MKKVIKKKYGYLDLKWLERQIKKATPPEGCYVEGPLPRLDALIEVRGKIKEKK